jgi:small subunit ribosomal protein S20
LAGFGVAIAVDVAGPADYIPARIGGPVPPLSFTAVGSGAALRQPVRRQEDAMANTPSAKKATRKIAARTAVNKSRRSRMRTFVRKVEEAIASGDHKAANAALLAAQPEIVRAAQKGIVHANTASRKVARLNHRVKALAAAAQPA